MAATRQDIRNTRNKYNQKVQWHFSFSKLKSPYLKLAKKISGFQVWYVDGSFIRQNLDPDFTNYGQHYKYDFIPLNEFWIDYEAKKELRFFIDHLLIENLLMGQGKSYVTAVTAADRYEKSERRKVKAIQELLEKDDKGRLKKVHRKLLFSTPDVKIWLVSGHLVRSLFNPSFTAGGHDKVYKYVPKGEVWIDDALPARDRGFVILHELYEKRIMSMTNGVPKKQNYDSAHEKALKVEKFYMDNPHLLEKRIKLELKRLSDDAKK